MSRYFYGVYPAHKGVRAFFGLLRFISEPDAIRSAHITVRGPYSRRLDRYELRALNHAIQGRQAATLLGPRGFVAGTQATVVLEVEIGSLKGLWHKPDFPDGTPHITVYDGGEKTDAIRILNVLQLYEWRLRFPVSDLMLLEPKLSERDGLLSYMSDLHRAYSEFGGDLPPFAALREMALSERLEVLRVVLSRSAWETALPFRAKLA